MTNGICESLITETWIVISKSGICAIELTKDSIVYRWLKTTYDKWKKHIHFCIQRSCDGFIFQKFHHCDKSFDHVDVERPLGPLRLCLPERRSMESVDRSGTSSSYSRPSGSVLRILGSIQCKTENTNRTIVRQLEEKSFRLNMKIVSPGCDTMLLLEWECVYH